MENRELAIKVEKISKCYRIGLKEEMQDTFAKSILHFIKSPLKNYKKYRSLYKFDDLSLDLELKDANANDSSDILWALRNVSFEVRKGEVLGIIGKNGAGKSTLLKILSRITHPTSGYAEIHGRVSSLLEVGTGFHSELTGRENIFLNGAILGMRKSEIDNKFDEIVDFSGVEKFIDMPVKRYSSGMRVRLAFSVAAHLDPEVLIIDEVLAVGDAAFQNKCINKMQKVTKEGRTVLFVSHNMPAVTRLCSRAILIDEGVIIDDGPADQIVGKYLSSGLDTTAFREWTVESEMPGGEVARLRGVRLRTDNGHISDSVDIRKDFKIEMEFDVLKSGYTMMPHFALRNNRNETVFITIDHDPEWRQRPRPKGRYISTVIVPGNLLAEGRLFVGCYLETKNDNIVQFSVDSAISFLVIDNAEGDSARGDYTENIPGIVRPLLKWNTRYCRS